MAPKPPLDNLSDEPEDPYKSISIHIRISKAAFDKADDMAKLYNLPLMKFLKAVIYERVGILSAPLDMREKK